jgi:UDP-2,3-diacylglucosamine pyrophosphatase LpxH
MKLAMNWKRLEAPRLKYSMQDAIIISDLHLGSEVCNAQLILQFFDCIDHGSLGTKELILNGDVFDSWDFRRLTKKHWKILSWLRKRSDQMKITWIAGNHDGPVELISHLLGLDVAEKYVLHSGAEKILVMHGHQFDRFLDAHPIVTWTCDVFYHWMQKIDKSFAVARQLKKAGKKFVRALEEVREKALAYAKKHHYKTICCGHTHLDEETEGYYNSGCWTESIGSYLAVRDGKITLVTFTGYKHEDSDCDRCLGATDQRSGTNLTDNIPEIAGFRSPSPGSGTIYVPVDPGAILPGDQNGLPCAE